jgi:DNA-binding MarR family transcriptional regulator
MTVGLVLLSRLHVGTSAGVAALYMLVLGLGIGLVLQVLVLAAQNAVDYRYLGVASSGSTLFRQIGGSVGVSVFGAIFANQLARNLVTSPYRVAVTHALNRVFLVAAGITVFGFVLSLFLREVPLKTTAQAPDVGDGFKPARDDDRLREIERFLSVLARREERWGLYERLAARAAVDLPPPELWLLARLGERAPLTESELGEQLGDGPGDIAGPLEELRVRGLVQGEDGGPIALTEPGRQDYERLVEARCAGLRELLDGWSPDEHPELRELVTKFGRAFVSEIPKPVPAAA